MGRIRIIGGEHGGRLISVPAGVRPTSGRLREALFSIWQHRTVGSRFADLFAGSGAVGFEAWSRGAQSVLMIDSRKEVARHLERAKAELGADVVSVRQGSVPGPETILGGSKEFDLVFADPPYDYEDYGMLIEWCTGIVSADGEIAIEYPSNRELAEECAGLLQVDDRVFGDSRISLYRRLKGET